MSGGNHEADAARVIAEFLHQFQAGKRALMAAQVGRIFKCIRGFSGVWIVRHDETAKWIKDNKVEEWTKERWVFGNAGTLASAGR